MFVDWVLVWCPAYAILEKISELALTLCCCWDYLRTYGRTPQQNRRHSTYLGHTVGFIADMRYVPFIALCVLVV